MAGNDNFRPPMDQMGPPPSMHGVPPQFMHDGPPPPPHMMDGSLPHMMDGPPPPHMMDGPLPPHMMDGPPPPHMMDGPLPPHMRDGPPHHMRDGPPHMMQPPPYDNNQPPMFSGQMNDGPQPLMSHNVEPTSDFTSKIRDQDLGEGGRKDFKLPAALEKMLSYKDKRAKQVGVTNESVHKALQGDPELERVEKQAESRRMTREDEDKAKLEAAKLAIAQSLNIDVGKDSLLEAGEKARKALKNKKKKEKKKKRRANKMKTNGHIITNNENKISQDAVENEKDAVDIEYVSETPDFNDPFLRQFKSVFDAFKIADEIENTEIKEVRKEIKTVEEMKRETVKNLVQNLEEEEENEEEKPKMSKRQLRRLNRLSVAELKQLVSRPDVVEMHDVTAQDPRLLVHLKASRNSVPVPRHWCFKRKYLQGKRGFEKPPFDLPDFIKSTGIMEMREALQEKEDSKNMKAKMREKVRPKMGKIDIDYQKLHDAFFRYQTKPRMTGHGDLYYETKELETRLKEKKPGYLSDELRTTLGMPLGATAHRVPPPWLIAMQRYGPPPSYPNLKISGLNCPIPDGCSFGYHVGGWGKPPVDEVGRPLYGDVFGVLGQGVDLKLNEDEIERQPWGALESESEEESSEEEEEEEGQEDQPKPDDTGFITPAAESGIATPSGISSVATGLETPDMIELRKRKIEDAMESGENPDLYTVLPEKTAGGIGKSMMGSSHVYDMAQARKQGAAAAAGVTDLKGVEVVLNPEELELDSNAMAAKYEAQVRVQQARVQKEDFSDMVAEHAAKQKKKRKAQTQDTKSGAKKYKEFKF